MTKLNSFLLLLLISMTMVDCGGRLTQDNFDKVRRDMSQKEVTNLLGKPTRTETASMPIVGTEITTYKYQTKKAEVEIIFRDNRVTVKTGSFSE